MLKRFPIAVLALALLATPVAGQDYHRGWAAFQKGDYAGALKEWRTLAESGHAVAQFNLGLMHAKGLGMPKDETEAVRWYRRAAEQGHVDAQNNLGFMYGTGRGVDANQAEAVMWLRRAAEQGDADAQYNLGVMYMKGRGVPRDHVQASAWYRKAAAQGQAKAMDALEYLNQQRRVAEMKRPTMPPATPTATPAVASGETAPPGSGTTAAAAPAPTTPAPESPAPESPAPPAAAKTDPPSQTALAIAMTVPGRVSSVPQTALQAPAAGSATAPAAPELPKSLPKAAPPSAPKAAPEKHAALPGTADKRQSAKAATGKAGGFRVQLLSVTTQARAKLEAGRLTEKYKPVLGSLKVVPVRADLGDRGVVYRLRAGPLESRAAAASLCRKLSDRKQGCLVVTR